MEEVMDNNRRHWVVPVILGILLIASIAWGYNQYAIRKDLEVTLDNHYQRLFHDVKEHVEKVQVSLSKALVASTIDRNILLFSQIMNDANFAQDKLAQLPVSHAEIGNTQKFLAQAADYSFYLIQRHLDGEDITDEQRKTLASLQNNSTEFNNELSMLHETMANLDLMNISTSLLGFKRNNSNDKENPIHTSLTNLEAHVEQTPELIYDGPFADQILNKKPQGLPNNTIQEKEAADIAKEFYGGKKDVEIKPFEQGENIDELRMPAHTFHLFPEGQQKELAVYMGVSQKGGKVLWMADPRPVGEPTISVEEAESRALEYLKNKGFDSMEPNYSLQYDGSILFNFAYKENDIVIYPDLVKVKVAMDTGDIVGFDASAYYMNHHNRDINPPTIGLEEAKKRLRPSFQLESARLAIIPKGKDEVLCYELKGKQDEGEFLIYVSAYDGKEEQILQLIQNENGTLTF